MDKKKKFLWISRHPLTQTQKDIITRIMDTFNYSIIHEEIEFDVDLFSAIKQLKKCIYKHDPTYVGAVMPLYMVHSAIEELWEISFIFFVNTARKEGGFETIGAWEISKDKAIWHPLNT